MKTLVIYDSQYGNTEQVAQAIGAALEPFGAVSVLHVGSAQPLALDDVDLLLLGCPTQGWKPTAAMAELARTLSASRLGSTAVACFDTRIRGPRWMTGSAAATLDKGFYAQGVAPLVPGESFLVQGTEGPLHVGEVERATKWARQLATKLAPAESAS